MFLEILWVASSLIPVLAFSALVLHSFFKRTSRGLLMLACLGVGQITVAMLKQYFAQARPAGACSTSYGYPSGHSGFASGLATWLLLEIIILHDKVPFKTTGGYFGMRNVCLCFIPFIPVSRYFLNYHSPEQIMYGLLTGFLCTVMCFGALMYALMHQGHGKFYTGVVAKIWKRIKFHDNLVSYHLPENVQEELQEIHNECMELQDHHPIHPFRDAIRHFAEKYLVKVPSIQQKVLEEI